MHNHCIATNNSITFWHIQLHFFAQENDTLDNLLKKDISQLHWEAEVEENHLVK